MKIAAAINEMSLKAVIPEVLESSRGLIIVETDTMEIVAKIKSGNWAREMAKYGCEAILCGIMNDPDLFESIANEGITRYYAGAKTVKEAVSEMLEDDLLMITDYVGGSGCSSSEGECTDECAGGCSGDCDSCESASDCEMKP